MSRIDYMKLLLEQILIYRVIIEGSENDVMGFIRFKTQLRGLFWLYYKERDRYGR